MDLWPAIYCFDGATFFVTPLVGGRNGALREQTTTG